MARLSKLQALSLVVLFLLHFSLQLQSSHGLEQNEPRQIYIVYLGERRHEDADLVTASHHDMLTSILGSKEKALESIVYSYKYGFSGFSARLIESQAKKIEALPGVVSVRKNQIHRTHTTRSWDFLGMDYSQPNGLLAKANYGDGIIIGVLDSGIWPESQSFADDGGYGPPPSKWKGTCQAGALFGPHNCNRKLIGARWYAKDVDKSLLKGEFMSARDANGHGTHTASTAGGNIVHNVSFRGLAAGTAHGGAPRARIAVYKICWGADGEYSKARQLKAMDDAIHDGVDVLSLSIGGPTEDPGTLHAVANGITVVYSAGNSGPTAQTVENSSPWLLTVAATTVDRQFPTAITLGNNQKLVGQSLFAGMEGRANDDDEFHDLVAFPYSMCNASFVNSIDALMGVVVFCVPPNLPGDPPAYDEIASVLAKKGGKGIIFSQRNTDGLIFSLETACKSLPCVAVDFEISNQILQYGTQYPDSPKVKISFARTTIGTGVPAPKVAIFSSRGPSPIYPGALKPDIAAPGVSILAAAPQLPLYKSLGAFYHFESGTSMSCPHVSGIVAVLKSLHPDWSPAALKSALMTTALTTDNNGIPIRAADEYRAKIADPFDYGAGFVNPSKAADPGLIYDISASDYLNFFNCMGGLGSNGSCTTPKSSLPDLNLPSIAIPNLKMSETVVRTVTNVGQPNAVYKAFFQPPAGVEMSVEPPVLVFCKESRVQSFKVTFKATRKIQGDYTFGSLAWNDGGDHWVRIPIAVRVIIEEFYSNVS